MATKAAPVAKRPTAGTHVAPVAIVNASTVCTDAELKSYVGPLQRQVSEHFAPVWGADAKIDFVPKGKKPPEILPGGYIGVWTPTTGWTQITGEKAHGPKFASRAPIGSRRERRRIGTARWYRSVLE